MPGIIKFLGYDPFPEPQTLGERLAAKRRMLGLSRKELAKRLGVDEETLARLETGAGGAKAGARARAFLAGEI